MHSFAVYKWPSSLLATLERSMRNFLWTGSVHEKKLITVPWKMCCQPYKEGGIGIKNLHLMNSSMLSTLAWKLISSSLDFPLLVLRNRFLYSSGIPHQTYFQSSVWASIKSVYSLLRSKIIWFIGQNSKLKFWTDEWIIPSIANQLLIPVKEQQTLSAPVSLFISNNQWNISHIGNNEVSSNIMAVSSSMTDEDICIWTALKDGKHSVKNMYNYLRTSNPLLPWAKFIWKDYLPPSRSFVCWRAILNYLPTEDKLKQRGLQFASRCSLCFVHNENHAHLFIHCKFAKVIWKSISSLFGKRIDETDSLLSLIQLATRTSFSSQVAVLWCSAIVQAVCVIWKTRNAAIFEDSIPNIHCALRTIWTGIKESDFFRVGCMHNSLTDLQILKLLNINGKPAPAPHIIPVLWHPPLSGWTKVNTDGSSLGSPGVAGGGGIFRNTTGFTKGAFAFPLGNEFAFVAELVAAIMAVDVAWKRGWHSLWLESDSSYVVQLFTSKSNNVPWAYLHRWLNCLHQVSQMNFQVSHIYREGNGAADLLAKHGASVSSTIWWSTTPSFCNSAVYQDYSSQPYYRFC